MRSVTFRPAPRGRRRPARAVLRGARAAVLCATLAALLVLGSAAPAGALPDASRMLAYMPTEDVHTIWSRAQVEGMIAPLAEYDIGQALFQMPRFTRRGTIKPDPPRLQMLALWSATAAEYDAAHGAQVSATAIFNGVPKARGLNLELPATRARMVAAVEATVLETGVQGVQLDIEPYPSGPGYISLLEELDAALGRIGYAGRLSVVAPGDGWTWSPSYLRRVGELVDQLDPTFYDTESASVPAYHELIEEGLAYYTANAPASASIIPVIPCYSPDPWHDPAIENVRTASEALGAALAEGSRVQGAGLWWWYSFYLGHYKHGDAAAERTAWLSQTLSLQFSP